MSHKTKRQRGHEIDQAVPHKIGESIRCQRQFQGKLEQEDRADRQIGPREKKMIAGSKPSGRKSAHHGLKGDQGKKSDDQDQHGIFENHDEAPPE